MEPLTIRFASSNVYEFDRPPARLEDGDSLRIGPTPFTWVLRQVGDNEISLSLEMPTEAEQDAAKPVFR
jgi:hypothetical protein